MKMMKASPQQEVRDMYESTAESYAQMMDAEIGLPVYADVLARLSQRIEGLAGPVVDTSIGSGHMLFKYRQELDPQRRLVGVDLSPRMVSIARAKLGHGAEVYVGDMRDLGRVESGSAAAVVSYFAIHHLDSDEVPRALVEWRRVLRPGGQLLAAAWEGSGPIDYGEASDVVAFRYTREELADWAEAAGLSVDRCAVEPVEGFPMDAIYLEGTRT